MTEEDLYAVEIPPRYLPEGVFLSPDHVVGQILHTRTLANEFIRAERVTVPPKRAAAEIPVGHRLIEFPLAPTTTKPQGMVNLVGPGGCLLAEDVYAKEVLGEGEQTTLAAILRIEEIGRVYAVAAAGELRISALDAPKRSRCSP